MLSEVTLINAAVGEKTGRLVPYARRRWQFDNQYRPVRGGREVREVRSVALSSFLENTVDFKLDVSVFCTAGSA
jgi:hypothetical protein